MNSFRNSFFAMPLSKFAKYTCDICQKTLRRKHTFEAHMKSHLPPDEKQFKCDRCDKSFGSQAWLTRHGRIHSGEGQGQLGIFPNGQEVAHSSGICENQNHFEVSWYETCATDPFTVFPREIWCMILENVAYFNDLLNIFEVYSELEVLHRRKRQLYLFDQVIPHIAEWMGERDLLNCRRVSKQWNMGVDSFLENHPSVRAYIPDDDQQTSSGSMWDPFTYSKCFHGQSFGTLHSENILYRKYFDASYIFDYSDDFTDFLYKTKENPLEINPFVGRSVTFDLGYISGRATLNYFWQRAFNFLSKWGEHIWFLKIVQGEQSDIQLSQSLRRSLPHLPNLRSLHLHGNGKQITCSQVTDGLLELPHLETLQTSNISFANPLVSQMLLPKYSGQIRRVQMELENSDMGRAARKKFSMPLPNLTELHITDIHIGKEKWKNGIDNILMSLDAPQLSTLGLRIAATLLSLEERAIVKDSELFGWLRRFPMLKQFHVPHERVQFDISNPRIPLVCESLESLCINIETLERSPDILTFFPSIQCLLLCAELAAAARSRSEEEHFRACNNEVHLERYWDVLGNLQKLNVIVLMCGEGWNGPRYRFLKGDIEKYLRKSGAIAK